MKRFTEEQIVAVLREAAAAPGAGRATARRYGIPETTLAPFVPLARQVRRDADERRAAPAAAR